MRNITKFFLLLLGLIVVLFVTSRYGWRLFGFNLCITPTGINAQEITVSGNNVRLKGDTSHSAPSYVGYVYAIKDHGLYIGLKYNTLFGFSNRQGHFDIEINCNTDQFAKIYFCNRAEEQLIWQRE